MNFLLLGPLNQKTNKSKRIEPIIQFLKKKRHKVFNTNDKITFNYIKKNKIGFIICSGYPYKINSKIVYLFKNKIINLHPALLPHGKGVGSLLFCIINQHQLGISIHYIDKDFDTGDIILEEYVPPKMNETFRNYYTRLLDKLNNLLFKNFTLIINDQITTKTQKRTIENEFYTRLRSEVVIEFFDLTYDIPVKKLKNFSLGYSMNESFLEEFC